MRNEGKKGRCGSVSGWCSEQRNGFTTPERRKFRRVHGLQFPLHPQQVTGWIVILIIVINTFAVLTPHLEPNSRSTLTLVIAAIFLTHISAHLVVLLMDPADPRIRSQPTNKILPEFDRGKHSHVIENGRCHLCNITTDSRRTKHCSICNKCIVRFDHHCKWLNNCIGARNYSAFLVCLISAILANLFVAGLSATELSFCLIPDRFANHHGANEANGANGTAENTNTAVIAPVSDIATIVAMFAIGVLSVVAAILLLHLCFFHGYIACLGLTTYEYVRKKRERNTGRPTGDGVDPRSNATAIQEHASARCVALSLRKSATKAIRSSGPYPGNERVTTNRLCLSVPRSCSNVESNRDQSTNSNVSVGLPTSSANLRPCPSVQLVHDAIQCCSMFGTLARSKKRSNGESATDTTDSVRVSTNTCVTVQRMSSVSVETAEQIADPAPIRMTGKGIWDSVLRSPRYVVAPMVDASELAWRLLSRRHGAHLCYTPMLHSSVFCRDPKYRRDALASTSEDRPLIVQFCGNEPNNLLEAALLAEPYCDAVDINIGCPQAIAKRGRYGAFLQDDWDLLRRIVTTLSKGLRVPVTCKLRVFPEIEKTVEYARMLEAAGARLLTVHGRTREQKGPLTGVASWEHIKAVRQAVAIPVFANGNVQCLQDVEKCIEETGVDGVMSAEGNLYNPYIFEARHPPSWEPALEYLDLVECHPAPASYIRGHLFKLFHHTLCLAENKEERENLAKNSTMESFKSVVYALRDRYLPFHEGRLIWEGEAADYNLKLPPWLCQAYVRQPPEEHVQKLQVEKIERQNETAKRKFIDEEGNEISRKRLKKLRRIARRPNRPAAAVKRGSDLCWNCPNPVGLKCVHKLCRQCCRNKCFTENLDCAGHRNLTRTRRQMAIEFAAKRRTVQESI